MKNLLSLLTISTLIASIPAPLLANTVQTRAKRDVGATTKDVTTGFNINIKDENWKKINKSDYKTEFNKSDNKWYIIIFYSKYMDENKFIVDKNNISVAGVTDDGIAVNGGFYKNPTIYRWVGVGEPNLPEINSNTGQITNWIIDKTKFQQGILWSYKKDWGFGKKLGNWIRIIN